jgi:hypothetical protein
MAGQHIAKTKQWPVSILLKNNKDIFLRKHGKSWEERFLTGPILVFGDRLLDALC